MKNPVIKFISTFIILFVVFYYFNILFFGITSPGNHYIPFLAEHLNYIQTLRSLLLTCSKQVLGWLGYAVIINQYDLLVAGRGSIRLVYSCLGLGLISFLSAFVIAYPKPLKAKVIFLITGIITIEFLNVLRFVLLALFWNKKDNQIIDHHTIFNITLYILIMISLYFWVKHNDKAINGHA